MNWEAAPQDYSAVLVLITLYIFMDRGVRSTKLSEVQEIVAKGNVLSGRAEFVLDELVELKFVTAAPCEGSNSYNITHLGTRWMESAFRITRGARYIFEARSETIALKYGKCLFEIDGRAVTRVPAQTDWAKWGAISALLALPLAILLWWLS